MPRGIAEMKRFYEKYHKDDSDFEFVAISIDEDRESAETYAQKAKLPFPVLLDLGTRPPTRIRSRRFGDVHCG